MYYYIYDEFVQDKRYERDLFAIENRLADVGISGRVARLALFKDASELIEDELRKGSISTVVVVGNDATVQKVMNAVATTHIPFGIIPLGPGNQLAKIMGIPNGLLAVETLSKRNVQVLDAGNINGQWFMTGVHLPDATVRMNMGGEYWLSTNNPATIQILNLGVGEHAARDVNPVDGTLNVLVHTKKRSGLFGRKKHAETVLPAKSLEILSEEEMHAQVDGFEMRSKRFVVGIEPNALQIITGKERHF